MVLGDSGFPSSSISRSLIAGLVVLGSLEEEDHGLDKVIKTKNTLVTCTKVDD